MKALHIQQYTQICFTENKLLVADINECQAGSHNCSGPAKCINFEGGFRCSCDAGYMLSDITYANCEGIHYTNIVCGLRNATKYHSLVQTLMSALQQMEDVLTPVITLMVPSPVCVMGGMSWMKMDSIALVCINHIRNDIKYASLPISSCLRNTTSYAIVPHFRY